MVDDDALIRAVMKEVLQPMGYRVVEARSAAEASKLAASEKLALTVVDGLLPDSDGVRWIQRERPRLGLVVFCSAFWKDKRSHDQLKRESFVDLIVHKPFNPRELRLRISTLVASRLPDATGDARLSA